jgi:hypothetical protein
MTGQQRLLLDIRALRAAPNDYREWAEGLRIDAAGARAMAMPLSSRVIDNYARIADRAARAEVDDPQPDPDGWHPCACDVCVAYMWRDAA